MPDRFVVRTLSLGAAGVAVAVGWHLGPVLRDRLAPLARAEAPPGLTPGETAVIGVFETARSGVVYISTAERIIDPWRLTAEERQRGTGSGFLWDDEGHVVTNWHVVEGADGATVRLADGEILPAGLVGAAPMHDIAVLRIEPVPEPPLPRGSSAGLRVGQTVLAIGNPFGLDWTLTTGIVSALDRELPGGPGRGMLRGLIQTDAAINPGNSGGPLLDSAGRLIGVNTAIWSPSGSSAGIGFAVPVDTLTRVVPQLIATGVYAPPGIGIAVDARVNAMAARSGIDGVLVLDVAPGSPAERAGITPARMSEFGLVPGDRIVAVDGLRVASPDDLAAAFDRHAAGETVRLTLRFGTETREVEVTLADQSR
jgi:S1-C subfamily serine protease